MSSELRDTPELQELYKVKRNANPWTRVRVAKQIIGPSLAKQSFKKECDINQIMRKFEKTGLLDHVNTYQGKYGNFIGFQDYQTSLNSIMEAEVAFSSIPSKIRARFNNDPGQFLEFAQNPENFDQMVEMGLADAKPPTAVEAEPAKEVVVPPVNEAGLPAGAPGGPQ